MGGCSGVRGRQGGLWWWIIVGSGVIRPARCVPQSLRRHVQVQLQVQVPQPLPSVWSASSTASRS